MKVKWGKCPAVCIHRLHFRIRKMSCYCRGQAATVSRTFVGTHGAQICRWQGSDRDRAVLESGQAPQMRMDRCQRCNLPVCLHIQAHNAREAGRCSLRVFFFTLSLKTFRGYKSSYKEGRKEIGYINTQSARPASQEL